MYHNSALPKTGRTRRAGARRSQGVGLFSLDLLRALQIQGTRIISLFTLLIFVSALVIPVSAQPKKVVRIFLDVRETNLEKPSTVATNTLTERLTDAGFKVTTNRREAMVVLDGTMASRKTQVTDDVTHQGGFNAEASASLRLLVGTEVIATTVQRTDPGDWGVQLERLGEDRLIELAGKIAADLFTNDLMQELPGSQGNSVEATKSPSGPGKPSSKTAKKQQRRGVSFLEVCALVQNSAPEERVIAALRKHGIKFKPRDAALTQLRGLGATEAIISAVKSCNVVVEHMAVPSIRLPHSS